MASVRFPAVSHGRRPRLKERRWKIQEKRPNFKNKIDPPAFQERCFCPVLNHGCSCDNKKERRDNCASGTTMHFTISDIVIWLWIVE